MKIKKLTEHIGAEISDIRIDSLEQSEVDEIKEAWLAHKVLVFRNQPISVVPWPIANAESADRVFAEIW